MGVNSLPKTVTGQRRGCDLNPGRSAPESSTLTTRLPSHRSIRITRIIQAAVSEILCTPLMAAMQHDRDAQVAGRVASRTSFHNHANYYHQPSFAKAVCLSTGDTWASDD